MEKQIMDLLNTLTERVDSLEAKVDKGFEGINAGLDKIDCFMGLVINVKFTK
jgi:hypothetical protein